MGLTQVAASRCAAGQQLCDCCRRELGNSSKRRGRAPAAACHAVPRCRKLHNTRCKCAVLHSPPTQLKLLDASVTPVCPAANTSALIDSIVACDDYCARGAWSFSSVDWSVTAGSPIFGWSAAMPLLASRPRADPWPTCPNRLFKAAPPPCPGSGTNGTAGSPGVAGAGPGGACMQRQSMRVLAACLRCLVGSVRACWRVANGRSLPLTACRWGCRGRRRRWHRVRRRQRRIGRRRRQWWQRREWWQWRQRGQRREWRQRRQWGQRGEWRQWWPWRQWRGRRWGSHCHQQPAARGHDLRFRR